MFVTGFVKTHVLDEHESEIVSELASGTPGSDITTCKLWQLKKVPKVLVVTCEVDVKPEETFLWTEQVSRLAVLLTYQHSLIESL